MDAGERISDAYRGSPSSRSDDPGRHSSRGKALADFTVTKVVRHAVAAGLHGKIARPRFIRMCAQRQFRVIAPATMSQPDHHQRNRSLRAQLLRGMNVRRPCWARALYRSSCHQRPFHTYGSGPLIRVVRDIGRIIAMPFHWRFCFLVALPRPRTVTLRQTFVPRCQPRKRSGGSPVSSSKPRGRFV
jgi:hypothetical protein